MKKVLSALLVLSLGASLYWNFNLSRELSAARARLAQDEEKSRFLDSTLKKDEAELARARQRLGQEVSTEARSIDELRSNLAAEKEAVEASRQRLLDARANLRESEDPAARAEAIRQQRLQVEGLEARLKALRDRESQSDAQARQEQQQGRSQQSAQDQELVAEIREQQAAVQRAVERVNGLKGRADHAGRQELQDAQKDLQEKRERLKALLAKKQRLDQQWGAQRSLSLSQGQAALSEFRSSEARIRYGLARISHR